MQIVARFLLHLIISNFASTWRFSFSFPEARFSVFFSSTWSFFSIFIRMDKSLHIPTFLSLLHTPFSAICWALLALPLITTSDAVVSSTYFHIWSITLSIARSLMRTRNNHGPNFVACGTPDGTEPHS